MARTMTVDPITLEVIYHYLDTTANEMEDALLRTSFSTIVKEMRDCSTAIFDAQGRTVAQAVGISIHLGTLKFSVPAILEEFPISQMREGDVYLANDPYRGGTHLPDVTMVTPVIYDGEVVALGVNMVHHQDIGAITPGVPTSATSIFHEGLQLPPLKFYDCGEEVKVVHDIIMNNVRVPDIVMGDMRAQVAAGNTGKVRIRELVDRYGKEVVRNAMDQLQDYSETLTRKAIEKIPDGTYSFVDYLDNDGVDFDRRVKIQVTVTVQGDEIIADLTGSNPQVKGPFNCAPSTTYAQVSFMVRALTGGSAIPSNDGAFRPIKIILPERSVVNPSWPSALGARATTASLISHVLQMAMLQAQPIPGLKNLYRGES